MNRAAVFIAVVLLATVLLLVLNTGGDREADVRSDGVSGVVGRLDSQSTVPDQAVRKLSKRKLAKESIAIIRDFGYQFSADRVNEGSALGNVTLVSPDGAVLKSDHLSISVDGEAVYLKGEIAVMMTSKDQVVRMNYRGEGASARIDLDGKSLSFMGGTMVSSISPDQDR